VFGSVRIRRLSILNRRRAASVCAAAGALLVPLVAASSTTAADTSVKVVDFKFQAKETHIGVGDTVTWNFAARGHTTTSARGQVESWSSGPQISPVGGRFQHAFKHPGRFQYFCIPHKSFMKGVIEVGRDKVKTTFSKLATRTSGGKATVTFRLNEPAKMSYKLSGPTDKTITRPRLSAVKQSIPLGTLRPGKYQGTLSLTDDFDNRQSGKSSFAIG